MMFDVVIKVDPEDKIRGVRVGVARRLANLTLRQAAGILNMNALRLVLLENGETHFADPAAYDEAVRLLLAARKHRG